MFKFIRRLILLIILAAIAIKGYQVHRDVKQVMTYQSLVREVLDEQDTAANEELVLAMIYKMCIRDSIHALQLTAIFPSHLLSHLPTIDWLGIYPSLEVVLSQAIFLVVVLYVTFKNRQKEQPDAK